LDIVVLGPGLWYRMHHDASGCDTLHKAETFERDTYRQANDFPCTVCRVHFLEYLKEHPIPTGARSPEDVLFWTWAFHNDRNRKSLPHPKPIVSWDVVRTYYMSPKDVHCEKSCAGAESPESETAGWRTNAGMSA
jgi:hypothetical protein